MERSAADKGLVIELDLPAQVVGSVPQPQTTADLLESLLRLAIAVAGEGTIRLRLVVHPGSHRLQRLEIDSSAVRNAAKPSEPYNVLAKVLASAQVLSHELRGDLQTSVLPGAGYSFTVTLPRVDAQPKARVVAAPRRGFAPLPAPPPGS